jgi:predicted RNA-binding Zn ribbon-like protein
MPPPAVDQYEEPKPAPGALLLVQSFVNTLDVAADIDVLTDAEAGGAWLRDSGLVGAAQPAGPQDLRSSRAAREAIRALLLCNGHGPAPDTDALRPLTAVAQSARLQLAVGPAGQVELGARQPGRLEDGLLRLLLIIRDAQQDGTWPRLKVCRNDECQWAFYDRSNSRRGTWCDMAVCGNVIKNRNLRARRGRG